VRCAGRVCAHEDLDLLNVRAGDLLKRAVKHRDVIGHGVRAGVARPQQARQPLPGLIGVGLQRVKAVAALVVAGRLLLLRVRAHQRRVDIDRQPLGRAVQLPEALARTRMRDTQRLQEPGVGGDPIDHPKRRRIRRDRPTQRLLITDRTEV
jgi:hypothetical protein